MASRNARRPFALRGPRARHRVGAAGSGVGGLARALAALCAASGAAALFALSYDGRIDCSPEDPDDAAIVALVNEHQRTDKGFGPALGPDATACAERCFAAAAIRCERARERLDADAGVARACSGS